MTDIVVLLMTDIVVLLMTDIVVLLMTAEYAAEKLKCCSNCFMNCHVPETDLNTSPDQQIYWKTHDFFSHVHV